MQKFDTNVQELKYKVLRAVARSAYKQELLQDYNEIAKEIVPGPEPTMRCCIYKERAIVLERIKLALGGNKNNRNVVEVLPIACDECPTGGYTVTDRCRGCIAHNCQKVCPKNAITFDPITRTAHIDKDKCVNCGLCAKACQYHAIQNILRPCEAACQVHAIVAANNKEAVIDEDKCIHCGQCVYHCPFGAIMDKSMIVDVINEIINSHYSNNYPIYAVIAPSIGTQFKGVSIGKVLTAIKKLGFVGSVEAAIGADIVAVDEAKELAEKGILTSSCCPAFASLIKRKYPELAEFISSNPSPMAAISKVIKTDHPDCKVVFIGPCIAKKMEIKRESVKPYVDYVLTFEELNAMIDSQNIDLEKLEESQLDPASSFGRLFARCGGVSDAVKESLKEQNIDFEVKGIHVDGLANCEDALRKLKAKDPSFNFIEGMSCVGGCIGGPCCLNHEIRDKFEIEKYGKLAEGQSIVSSVSKIKRKK